MQVTLFGGCVTSWRHPKHGEVLYIRPDAVFDKSKPIAGGIPICFPQVPQATPLPPIHNCCCSAAGPGNPRTGDILAAYEHSCCYSIDVLRALAEACSLSWAPSRPPDPDPDPPQPAGPPLVQFGPGRLQQHGFARNMDWKLESTSASGFPGIQLLLKSTPETRQLWWAPALCMLCIPHLIYYWHS